MPAAHICRHVFNAFRLVHPLQLISYSDYCPPFYILAITIASDHFIFFCGLRPSCSYADVFWRAAGPYFGPVRVTDDQVTLVDASSPSQADAPPSFLCFFPPAHVDFLSRLAADSHSSVSDPLPTRTVHQRPTETGRSPSLRRLCSGHKLLRTSPDIPSTGSRALTDCVDEDGGRSIRGSASRLLVPD